MAAVREIERALYELAPRELAMERDNVGLLIGRPDREVTGILVALDVTEETAAEAVERGANLIVAHHPVMNCNWNPVQTIRDDDPRGRLFCRLVEQGLSAICMHTNLDRAHGGVNDVLAAMLGLGQVEELPGGDGVLRSGVLPGEMDLPAFLAWVKAVLRPGGIRYVDGGRPIHKVAVGGGACGDYFRAAAADGCDALVTSDVSYHEFADARALGLTLLDAGHFPTEDVVCPLLVRYLREKFPEVRVEKSNLHKEVIQYYI